MIGCAAFPIPADNPTCGVTDIPGARILSLEWPRMFAEDYMTFGNPAVKTAMDTLMSGMFSEAGNRRADE